jgi:putative addiction module component (TIGR02574 family)
MPEISMRTNFALNEMTIEEKISIMENIWDDLCKNSDNIKSPGWHKNILNERENQIKNNKAEFIDWEAAKKNIRENL